MQLKRLDNPMARLQLDIDPDLKQRLKLMAVREDRTMSDVVEAALLEYLKKKEGK
jgi:predicted transcriptional regulator